MSVMVRFNADQDYKPEIPTGESCQSCVFATSKYREITAPATGESLALCRRLTGLLGLSVWLRMGDDGHPIRCKRCVADFPYGATFDLTGNEKPLTEVEKAKDEIVKAVAHYLTESCQWPWGDGLNKAEKMANELIDAVKKQEKP
jgi:hypothetical protein